jgi:hypothetical protein
MAEETLTVEGTREEKVFFPIPEPQDKTIKSTDLIKFIIQYDFDFDLIEELYGDGQLMFKRTYYPRIKDKGTTSIMWSVLGYNSEKRIKSWVPDRITTPFTKELIETKGLFIGSGDNPQWKHGLTYDLRIYVNQKTQQIGAWKFKCCSD